MERGDPPEECGADHDDVTDDQRRRRQAGRNVFQVDFETVFLANPQVDDAILAEGRIRFTRRGIQ